MGENKNNLFPLEIFPDVIQDIIRHNKEVQNFDINLQAGAYLSAMASSLGTSVGLNNGKFGELIYPALWVVLIGSPGSKKSHIIKHPFKAIRTVDSQAFEQYSKALREWKKENRNERGDKPEPSMTILDDFTLEALIKNHRRNPKGLAIIKDELAGWLKDFNKYNSGKGERDQYLTLFNCPDLKVDRAGAETEFVSKTCVNIIGGIQPKRAELIMQKGSDDGFALRWLFCTAQTHEPDIWGDSASDDRLLSKAYNFMMAMTQNHCPHELTLSKSANDVYAKWHNQKNLEFCYNDTETEWQKKMETYVWRFCIVIHAMQQTGRTDQARGSVVEAETMEKALLLAEFFTTQRKLVVSSQNTELLEKESDEFQNAYRVLGLKPYKKKELDEHFLIFLTKEETRLSDRTLANKYNSPLFTKQGYGLYIKAVINV